VPDRPEKREEPRTLEHLGWVAALILLVLLLLALWPREPEPVPQPQDLPPLRAAIAQKPEAPEEAEAAIHRGLIWLVEHQGANGAWPSGSGLCPERSRCSEISHSKERQIAATALAALAFLGRGISHVPEPSPDPARAEWERRFSGAAVRALDAILAAQAPDGSFAKGEMYTHAQATLALVEGARRTGRKDLEEAARKGVDFIARSQSDPGGWDYQGQGEVKGKLGRSDTSITAWAFLALLAAHEAGMPVPDQVFLGVVRHFRQMTDPKDQKVSYDHAGGGGSRTCLAIGLFCRLFLGYDPVAPPVKAQSKRLLASAFPPDQYFWYHASVAAFQVPDGFPVWNRLVQRSLIGLQVRRGHAAGSWDPVGAHANDAGRAVTTALCVSALEVYFRHASLAMQKIAGFPAPHAVVRALAAETDPAARLAWVEELGLMRADETVESALAARAREDSDAAVRKAAETALAAIRARRAGRPVTLEATVAIEPGRGWTSSEIDLLPGETVTLTLAGERKRKGASPAEAAQRPLPAAPDGALLVRIGLEDAPFVGESGKEIKASRYGSLFLGINAADPQAWSGHWKIEVTVREGGAE